jgi:hypothetical protein
MRRGQKVVPVFLVAGALITIIGRVVFHNEILVIVGVLTTFLPVLLFQIVPSYRSIWRASKGRHDRDD